MQRTTRSRRRGAWAGAAVLVVGMAIGTAASTEVAEAATARVSIGDAQVLEGDAGTPRLATFALTLDDVAATDVRVDWMILPGTATASVDVRDFGGAMKKTTIRAGKVSAFVNVMVYADTVDEGNETFQVHLMNASGASLDDHMGDGVMIDDDPGSGLTIGVGDISVHEGNTLERKAKFWVNLSSPAVTAVTVDATLMALEATEGIDYKLIAPKHLVFQAGQYRKAVVVTVYSDTASEGNEQFHIMLENPVGATAPNNIGMVTIVDDDGMFPLTTARFTMGPYALNPLGQAGSESIGFGSAPRPTGVVGIKNMRFDLVDAAGNHLDHHSAHFHHVVLLDGGRNDALCPSIGYNRFTGAGKERTALQLSDDYVYRTDASSPWLASWHVMNMSNQAKTVYIEYEIDYVTGTDLAVAKDVDTYFYDVDGCWGDSEFVVPGTGGPGSIFTKSITYTAPRAGTRVATGGHVHDGGIDITTKRTASNTVVCTNTAVYDSMNMLAAITPCNEPSAIAANEQFTVTARYENDTAIPDAMGIAVTYVYEP